MFLWRRQRLLAALYLGLLGLGWLGYLGFGYLWPDHLDTGAAVALRALAYHDTFDEVERAGDELDAGRYDIAEKRLKKYLAEQARTRRAQLHTHAVFDAHETLANVYLRTNRAGKAVKTLKRLTKVVPLDYRAWYLRGQAAEEAGDLGEAEISYAEAFRLSLHHPQVVDAYVGVLGERNAHELILWVHDQHLRAEKRAGVLATVKVGRARGSLQRGVMTAVGIPLEHAQFFRSFELRCLPRGPQRTIHGPADLLRDWPYRQKRLPIQVRFEHIYGAVTVDKVVARNDAGETKELVLTNVRSKHRHQSAREAYVEFEALVDPRKWTSLDVVYSCPVHELSSASLAIIDKARANLAEGDG